METEEILEHSRDVGIHLVLTLLALRFAASIFPTDSFPKFDGFPYYSWWIALTGNVFLFPLCILISIGSFEGSWNEYLFGEGPPLSPAEWFVVKHVIARLLAEFLIFEFNFQFFMHHAITITVTYVAGFHMDQGQRLQILAGVLCELGSGGYNIMCVAKGRYFNVYKYGHYFSNSAVSICCCLYFLCEKNNFFISLFQASCGFTLSYFRMKDVFERCEKRGKEMEAKKDE